MKLSDIPPIALRSRKVGETLVHPCGCGRVGCTIGEHVWYSTRDMTAGPRAANTDPGGGNRWENADDESGEVWPVPNDTVGEAAIGAPEPIDGAHAEYVRILAAKSRIDDELDVFLASHRPDRLMPTPETVSDSEYCAHHLATIGKCEPRSRGDLCRACYDFQLAYSVKPPLELLQARHEGRRWTDQMIQSALKAAKPKGKKKRRGKAS